MTKYRFDLLQQVRLVLALSVGGVLAACGGGNDQPPPSLTFQGVAEEGPPMVDGSVLVSCGNGAASATRTTAGGAFKVTVPATGDCIVEVTSLSGDVSLVSIESTNSATLNVTPITQMVAEFAAGRCNVGAPTSVLGAAQQIVDAFRANAAFRSALGNQAFVSDTQNQVFSFIQSKYKLNIYAVLGLNTAYGAESDTDVLLLQAFGLFDKTGSPTLPTLNTMYSLGAKEGNCGSSIPSGGTGGTIG